MDTTENKEFVSYKSNLYKSPENNVFVLSSFYESDDKYYPPHQEIIGVYKTLDEVSKVIESLNKELRPIYDDEHFYELRHCNFVDNNKNYIIYSTRICCGNCVCTLYPERLKHYRIDNSNNRKSSGRGRRQIL